MSDKSNKSNQAIADLNAIAEQAPVEVIAAPDPMKQPLWEIDNRVLDPFADLPPTMTWGHMGERPAIERQGIITVSAKPKQGKSLSVYALLTSIVSGTPIDSFTPAEPRPRLVIVFDTEMNKPTLQRRARCIYQQLGEQRNRFMIVPLLAVPKSERKEVIEDITAKFQPDIVAMDVVTKLVNDFNSSDENAAFGDWLEKYAEQRTVIVVIHQNKSKDDTSMKGHLGSILGEAAVENFTATMKNEVFTLTPVNARNSCAEGAPGVSFTLADNGTFAGAAQVLAQQSEDEAERWRANFRMIFNSPDETLSFTDLRDRICKREGLTQDAAERKITKAKALKAIGKTGSLRNDPYHLT